MLNHDILDQEHYFSDFPPRVPMADTGQRFVHHLVDGICLSPISLFTRTYVDYIYRPDSGFGSEFLNTCIGLLIYYLVATLFFTLFEGGMNGKTPGKFVTKTRAVRLDGEPLSYGDAFRRSLCRLIPFDALSFLNNGHGWHDTVSKTKVVKEIVTF